MTSLFDRDATTPPIWSLVVVCCIAVFLHASPVDASRDLPVSLGPSLDEPVFSSPDLTPQAPVRRALPFFSVAYAVALSVGLTYDYDDIPSRFCIYDGPGRLTEANKRGGFVHRHLFQGLWTDPVAGIAYARNRWYDARTASWLSEDPMGAVDSPNLYAFVGWGPHVGRDPMGLFDLPTHITVSLEALKAIGNELPLSERENHDFYLGVAEGSIYPDLQIWWPLSDEEIERYYRRKGDIDPFDPDAGKLKIGWQDAKVVGPGLRYLEEALPSIGGVLMGAPFFDTHYGGDTAWQHGTSSRENSAEDMQRMLVNGVRQQMREFSEHAKAGRWREAGVAVGRALHYLQDTYTPSHAYRDPETGTIIEFFDYAKQSPYLHALADRPEVGGAVFNNAVDQSRALLKLFLSGNDEGVEGFFAIDDDAFTGRPGQYAPRPEGINPVVILAILAQIAQGG